MKHLIRYSIVALTMFFTFAGMNDAAAADEKAKSRVKLTLRTVPKGAKVFIDGTKLTETTPLETILADHHEHMVELRAEGYESKWLRIPDTHGAGDVDHDFGEIQLREVKVPMIIRSVPSGAFVNLAGEDIGKTPIYLKGVSPGKYDAVFKFAGHASMSRKIEVAAGELKVVNVSLSSITGTLTVVTKPGDADVFLDGNRKGTSDADGRLVISDVDEGRHEVKAVKSGFYDLKQKVTVKANENTVSSLPEMRKLPGNIKVTSQPAGAKVYRDTMLMGETPMVMESLEAKEYTVKVELPGYDVGRKLVTVVPGMTKQVDFSLDSIYGSTSITTKPSECTIIIDGVKRGVTEAGDAPGISKPMVITKMKPGVHIVTIEKAGYRSASDKILVARGKETRVPVVTLKKLWLPTHTVKVRGEMRPRQVKILNDDGRNVEIEYKQGNEIIRYQVKKSDLQQVQVIK